MADTSSGRLVSFLIDNDEVVSCEVCLEPFEATNKPPKLLPCGHNFCERCLFSISCHQQYYMLEWISCPTCRAKFPSHAALEAPTNYDLCKILESIQKGRDDNVTVIHMPDLVPSKVRHSNKSINKVINRSMNRLNRSLTSHNRSMTSHNRSIGMTSQCRSLADKTSVDGKHHRCLDCRRKLSSKTLAKVARHCQVCSKPGFLSFACLECCVNKHNGHQLMSIQQLEAHQLKVLNELRGLREKVLNASEAFDRRLDEIKTHGCGQPALACQKQALLTETLSSLDGAIRKAEGERILPPASLSDLRTHQLLLYSKLAKLNNYLEKCTLTNATEQPRFKRDVSTSSLRQSRLTMRSDDSVARQALTTLVALIPKDDPNGTRLEKVLAGISPRDLVEDRKAVWMQAATIVTDILYKGISSESLSLYADVLLNCFYQLNLLSKRRSGVAKTKYPRDAIWKNVQFAYTEVLKNAAKCLVAYHPDRVDLLDDLAFLCHLYADVCDQGTVTICMIEAARARASDSKLSEKDREFTDQRLKMIDDHLVECRRLQKLQQLRSSSERKKESSMKKLFKSCFAPRVHA